MGSTVTTTTDNDRKLHYQSAIKVGVVILVAGLAAACAQYKVSTIMTTIAPWFGLNSDVSSWLMSIFTLVGIFCALPSGAAAQRFGFKKVIVGSLALLVAGAVIGLLSGTSGAILIFSRGVEGVALTFITACAPIAIQRTVDPKKMGLATGLWGCWGNGGAVLASVLTPQIFASAGFEGVWIVFAVFAVIAAVLVAVFIREPPASILREAASIAEAPSTRYRELMTKNTCFFLISFVAYNIIMLALLGMLPSILMLPGKGFSMSEAGFATTFASLLSLASVPIFGIIADRTGRLKTLYVITLSFLAPGIFLCYTQTGILFWAGATLMGIVGFGCVGLSIAEWMRIIPRPELVPKAMGVLTLVQCLGQFLGTFLVQLILGGSYENWFVTGIVLLVVAVAAAVSASFVRLDDPK